jgi:hypothetical protein
MPTKTPPKASIDLNKKRARCVPKTPEPQRKAKTNSGISPVRTAEWWYEKYFEQGLETGHWNLQKLPGWCQATGRLNPEAKPPHERTLLRWSSQFKWRERRIDDLRHLTEKARARIEEMILLRSMNSYRNWMRTADDLKKQVALFLNAAEVYDEELGWIERKDPFAPETRPTRLRTRLLKEYGGRGNPLNHANLERLVKVALNVQTTLPKLLPPGLQMEQQEEDQRGALTIVTPDKGQIAELSAGFGKLVQALAEKTEQRRIERGLNVFGGPIEEPPPLDAPGRDMLELGRPP